MSAPDIQGVAASLTEAQREIIRRSSKTMRPAFMLTPDHLGARVAVEIKKMRRHRLFIQKIGGAQVLNYSLTPLGLALKAHLAQTGEE